MAQNKQAKDFTMTEWELYFGPPVVEGVKRRYRKSCVFFALLGVTKWLSFKVSSRIGAAVDHQRRCLLDC